MRESLFGAAILLLSASYALASQAVPFSIGEQGGVVVEVTLDGHGPFKMLLDTGATHSAVTTGVLESVGARVVAQSNVISPAGAAMRPIVALESMRIGPITVDVVLPSIAPERTFDTQGVIKGLIGQDVLAGLRYTIDYKRRVIEWGDTRKHNGTPLSLVFDHGRFLVALPQAGGTVRFVPDSGSGSIVLFADGHSRKLAAVDTGETVELWTGVGRRLARVVRLPAFRIGSRTMKNLSAVSITGESHPGAGDGLLPLHLFDRVTFDGPGRLLIVG